MAQSTKIFLYHQRHRVVLLDTTGNYFTSRYQQMYTRNLKVSRGTDNQILFEFVNQDQKPVNITDMELTFRIINVDETLLLEKDLIILNAARGQAKLYIEESELDQIPYQQVYYSVERTETGQPYEPVYIDDNASARGIIEVLNQVMPAFVPSQELSIPTTMSADIMSSVLATEHQSLYTVIVEYDNFTGDLEIQGATNDNDDQWYIIESSSLNEVDGLVLYNVIGFHPYIRFSFTNIDAGTVTRILYR